MEILTPRLKLVPATAATHRMESGAHDRLGRELDAIIPAAWPPENLRDALEFFAQQLDSRPVLDGWRTWYWLATTPDADPRTLVGSGGFLRLPDEAGTVEIGYGTLDEFQSQGYATESVRALTEWAFQQPGIARVTAEAEPKNRASVRVLEKCKFTLVVPGSEADHSLFDHCKTGEQTR